MQARQRPQEQRRGAPKAHPDADLAGRECGVTEGGKLWRQLAARSAPAPHGCSRVSLLCALRLALYIDDQDADLLAAELRKRVDERADAEGKPMAEIVREALEQHLAQPLDSVQDLFDDTFGSVVDAWAPPRDEWDRR